MARDPQLHARFKEKVRAYYKALDEKRMYGAKLHTTAYCIAQTADHFDRRPKSIENIIYA